MLCLHRAVCRLSLAIVDLLYDFSTVVAVRLRSTTYIFYVNFSSVQRSSSIPSPSGCKFFISYFFLILLSAGGRAAVVVVVVAVSAAQ